jgi:hypothetical protein
LSGGNGVRDVSLWNEVLGVEKEVLGVEKTVFESVEYDQEQDLLVARFGPRNGRGVVAVPQALSRL